ncbi:MAG: ATP/GTP-binding protein [Candidatus Bathyarchaeia archaeon]
MFLVFVLGLAGSGKSLLTYVFQEWLKSKDQNTMTLNLDPGVGSTPYNPDFDIRDFIDLRGLMEEYRLGPNGALIMAADLIGDYIEEIRREVEYEEPDILLVDTPGQIELFAFRESGPFITKSLSQGGKAVIYLFDAPFCTSPLNFVSNMFLAAAVYNRLLLPQVYALSKSDLVEEERIAKMVEWGVSPQTLDAELEASLGSSSVLIARQLADALSETGLMSEPIPVSSKNEVGLLELYAALTRILTGGEEVTY